MSDQKKAPPPVPDEDLKLAAVLMMFDNAVDRRMADFERRTTMMMQSSFDDMSQMLCLMVN
jgi:hypothetical protein